MITSKNVKLYSKKQQKQVTWDISLVEEEDEGGNVIPVYLLKNGTEIHRLSPHYTDEELQRFVKNVEEEL